MYDCTLSLFGLNLHTEGDQKKTRMQMRGNSAPFHWQRSDNSFSFTFSPVISPSPPQSIMDPDESQTGHAADSESSSGFAFNFRIPAESEQKSDPEPCTGKTVMSETAQGSESSTSKKKKKKKKKPGAAVEENVNKTREEAPKQESTELTPEQQLSRELDWCIEQLELGLRTQKSSTKQREEASRALKTLRSSKAPMVKKRQVMRAVSGDYRKKMEQDRERQYKLISSAMSSAKVTCVSEPGCRAVYHRRAETHRPPAHNTDASPLTEQTHGTGDRFVFRPSGEEFRFNFSL
ncbi:UPF0488 protein C8orf33 homolog isoform X1 [Tachysurus fulvidraco]|uniref:UPF0488 protein C8orf33 homolog isoform X1 n=3 Tax=Tachysurus fulvidraco TaxID=1234273 RepID=UPI000F4FD336|nr:UPF0488 protein C8orf33 homolog isoform X1 [Tachysurus fulvidraco]